MHLGPTKEKSLQFRSVDCGLFEMQKAAQEKLKQQPGLGRLKDDGALQIQTDHERIYKKVPV